MRVVVTGGAGFIGANVVRGLNARGVDDIVVVDDLTQGDKFLNLVDLRFSDFVDQREFYDRFARREYGAVECVFHEGACSDTTERNGRFMMDNNYTCSRRLMEACAEQRTRLLYASSAAVYGASSNFTEDPANEKPLNVYGYSKLLMDQVVRRALPSAATQIAGFRYFNVYGPRERHKGRMASVAFHHHAQLKGGGPVRLFGEYGGYGGGEQSRDFVYIDDLVAVKLWFFDRPSISGVFNLGTGRAQPFNDVALAVVNSRRAAVGEALVSLLEAVQAGAIAYVPFPEDLVGRYQCWTQADLTALRSVGCDVAFRDVQSGVRSYCEWLERSA